MITSVFERRVNIVAVKKSVSLTGFKTGHLRVPYEPVYTINLPSACVV